MENIQLLHTINSQIWSLPTILENFENRLYKLYPLSRPTRDDIEPVFCSSSPVLFLSLTNCLPYFFTNHTIPKYFNCLKFTSLSILHPCPLSHNVMKFEKCSSCFACSICREIHKCFPFPFFALKNVLHFPANRQNHNRKYWQIDMRFGLVNEGRGGTSIPEKPISIE